MNPSDTLTFSNPGDVPRQFTANIPSPGGLSKDGTIGVYNLVKEYPVRGGTRRVLDDISFEVRPGEKIDPSSSHEHEIQACISEIYTCFSAGA